MKPITKILSITVVVAVVEFGLGFLYGMRYVPPPLVVTYDLREPMIGIEIDNERLVCTPLNEWTETNP